jgi:hypothetical protein
MNLYVKDPQKEYQFKSDTIQNLEGVDNTISSIEFWSTNCSSIYSDAINNNQSFNLAWKKCSEVGKNLTLGVKNLLLRIDCPGCGFKEISQCYSFKICIFDSNSSLCDGLDYSHQLDPLPSCPKDWWY